MMLKKVLQVYKNEGLFSVARRSFAYMFHNILSCESYYLVKITVQDEQTTQKKKIDFTDELSSKWIESNIQADEIAKEYEDFRPYAKNAHRILDAGGIATCTYVGKEFANISWIATTKNAMTAMSRMPMYVGFENKEIYAGYSYTVPRYRRRGLRYYRYLHVYPILKEKGIETERTAIRSNNYAALKANADRPNHIVYTKAHLFRIMGLSFWKETPMNVHAREIVDKMDG